MEGFGFQIEEVHVYKDIGFQEKGLMFQFQTVALPFACHRFEPAIWSTQTWSD